MVGGWPSSELWGLLVIVGVEEVSEGLEALLVGGIGAFVGSSPRGGFGEIVPLFRASMSSRGLGFCCWRWVQMRSEMRRLRALVASLSKDLGVSDQTIYNWRRQDLIDRGVEPGSTSVEHAELRAARRRIRELETDLAVTKRAIELLKGKVVSTKDASR